MNATVLIISVFVAYCLAVMAIIAVATGIVVSFVG